MKNYKSTTGVKMNSNNSFNSNYKSVTGFGSRSGSKSHNNINITLINYLKEYFSIFKNLQLQSECKINSIPNIVIIGIEKSGKSSFIEYLLKIDLLSLSKIKSTLKIELVFTSTTKSKSTDLNSSVQDELIKISVYCNEDKELSFTDLKLFQDFIEENDLEQYLIEGFITLRIEIPRENIDYFFFDCNIYEINIEDLISRKYTIPNNIISVLVSSCDNVKHLEDNLKFLLQNYNTLNIYNVFTKPDKFDSNKDFIHIQNICNKFKLKYCFIRLRSYDERKNYNSLKKFSDIIEMEYYKSRSIFNSQNIKDDHLIINIFDSFIYWFNNNLANTYNFLHENFYNQIESLPSGISLPADNKMKFEIAKRRIKNVIKYSKEVFRFNCQIITKFLETNVYHAKESSLNTTSQTYYKDCPELVQLLNYLDTNTHFMLYPSIQNEIHRKISLCNSSSIPSMKELEDIFFSTAGNFIEENFAKIKLNFYDHTTAIIDEINRKIYTVFNNIIDPFNQKLSSIFSKMIEDKRSDVNQWLSRVENLERNFNYTQKKKNYDYFCNSYRNLVNNNLTSDKKYEEFANTYISFIIKDKSANLIESYCKVYIYHFYMDLIEQLSDLSVENLIIDNFDKELTLYQEYKEVTEKREFHRRNIDELIKLTGLLIKIVKISNIEQNFSLMSLCNHKNPSTSKDITEKNPEIKNLTSFYAEINAKVVALNDDKDNVEESNYFKTRQCQLSSNDNSLQSFPLILEDDLNMSNTKILSYNSIPLKYIHRNKEFVMVWDNTNQISVYNFETNKITQRLIASLPYGQFLEDNRYINICDIVYITGGIKPNKERSNLFIELHYSQNQVLLLDNIPESKIRHSLIYIPTDNSMVVVGGIESRNTFMYLFNDGTWKDFGMNLIERIDPSLLLFNNYLLFAIGGCKSQKKNEFIEFKSTLDEGIEWSECSIDIEAEVTAKTLDNLFFLSGAGVIPSAEKYILLGGYHSLTIEDSETAYELVVKCKDIDSECKNGNGNRRNKNIDKGVSHNLKVLIKEKKIEKVEQLQSWFPENNFILFNESKDEFMNFNVDGEIVKYYAGLIEIIPGNFNNL